MALTKKPSPGTLGGGVVAPVVAANTGAAPGNFGKGLTGAQAPTFDTTYGSAFAKRQFVKPQTATPTGPAPTVAAPAAIDSIGRKKTIYSKAT